MNMVLFDDFVFDMIDYMRVRAKGDDRDVLDAIIDAVQVVSQREYEGLKYDGYEEVDSNWLERRLRK